MEAQSLCAVARSKLRVGVVLVTGSSKLAPDLNA